MPAFQKGEAVVELSDGRTLRLAYDFEGLIALEEASGLKMRDVYAELQKLERSREEPPLRLVRAIFFGGLQQHHPEITLREVGEIILTDMEAIGKAMKAFNGSHGPAAGEGGAEGDSEAGPSTAPAGTGASSSKAGAARGSSRKASGGKRSGPSRRR